MYCEKLSNIVNNDDSPRYSIDKLVVEKLHIFLRDKTTLEERYNINPVRFAIEMNVEDDTAIMVYIIGTKCKLFKLRFYYNCPCGGHFELSNSSDSVTCEECNTFIPIIDRDRTQLYFQLLEKIEDCKNFFENRATKSQLDFLEGDDMGKSYFSLADTDSITGVKGSVDAVFISQREDRFRNFIVERYDDIEL